MIQNRIEQIHTVIRTSCQSADRDADTVTLLAVSKRQGCDKILQAYESGQRDFGENYLNEALAKQGDLAHLDINWHFIGHIQSNKTRKIAESFSWVHAVDNLKVARRLSLQRPSSLSSLNMCLQVNIDEESSKAGIAPNEETLFALAKAIMQLPNLRLRGLMCIPTPQIDPVKTKESFLRMKFLMDYLNAEGCSLDTLSMGMSDDLNIAIECGSTIVRVGTAIFGVRH